MRVTRNPWLAIDRACAEVLRSDQAITSRLRANRRLDDDARAPFVNVPLGRDAAARRRALEVQRIVAETLRDPLREKARYQSPWDLHTTLVRVDEDRCPAEIFAAIASVVSLEALRYEITGAHLTADLVVILELRSLSDVPVRLRREIAETIGRMGWLKKVPNVHHATVARLVAGGANGVRAVCAALARVRRARTSSIVRGGGISVWRNHRLSFGAARKA
jgi:hypothetical protein